MENEKNSIYEELKKYKENIEAPWGKLFYNIIYDQLGSIKNKKILDFGSGFGVTSNYFAKDNEVTAIEPNRLMLQMRYDQNEYTQWTGSIECLKNIPDETYDYIICHNVIEYIIDRKELLLEFNRVLKKDGTISIVKHNKLGKIMQKAILEYNIEEALSLLVNENIKSSNFGTINLYENEDIKKYSQDTLKIEDFYGVRIFFALQNNDLKKEPDWLSKMFILERKVDQISHFRDIAFFHHLIIKKICKVY